MLDLEISGSKKEKFMLSAALSVIFYELLPQLLCKIKQLFVL